MSFAYLLNKKEEKPERRYVDVIARYNNTRGYRSNTRGVTIMDANDPTGRMLQTLFVSTTQDSTPVYRPATIAGPMGNHMGLSCYLTDANIETFRVSIQTQGVIMKAYLNNVTVTSAGLPLDYTTDRRRAKVSLQ